MTSLTGFRRLDARPGESRYDATTGWSDAGTSATTAVRYLTEQLLATKFASIDPEEFYDFSVQRPQVRLTEGTQRQIHWPSYDFYYGGGLGAERDFIFGVGAEPHLRWKAFSEAMLRAQTRAKRCTSKTRTSKGGAGYAMIR